DRAWPGEAPPQAHSRKFRCDTLFDHDKDCRPRLAYLRASPNSKALGKYGLRHLAHPVEVLPSSRCERLFPYQRQSRVCLQDRLISLVEFLYWRVEIRI